MNKTVKRAIIVIVVFVAVCAAVWGVMVLFRNTQKKPINVYAVSDFAMTDYWGDSSETSGLVTTDKLQKIMISDTQKISEIYVEEGQSVREGDTLLCYDTTLSGLEVKKAEIELQRQKLQLAKAQEELQKLNAMKPYSSVLITPDNNIQYQVQTTPYKMQGTGTMEDPVYYLWGEGDIIGETLFQELPEESQEMYAVLLIREHNALNGQILESWGVRLIRLEDGISMQLFVPDIPEKILKYDAEKEPYYEESGSEYTAAELGKMRSEKAQEIKDTEIAVKIAEMDYKKIKSEVEDGKVLCTVSGTVTVVRNPDEAYRNEEPVIEVSGGGGYYIDGTMSELEMEDVAKGQKVQINSWMTGTVCEGEIVEIFTYPVSNRYSYSGGNNNVSYYPFRIFVDESAALQEDEYVNITYQSQALPEECLYLENPFIRTENGKSYVYVRNEMETLEKRYIQTGKDLYGSYTQILGGVTLEDYIAFPYGNDVSEGAKTKEASIDEFYTY
ncbi:MAG: hypothetical protein J5983_04180 [Ruminococcus sp.]|nr:hypothetical protein [Ruminococcus sp.]